MSTMLNPATRREAPKSSRKFTTSTGKTVDPDAVIDKVRGLKLQATQDRRRYEAGWALAQSFVAGRQWVGFDPTYRRVVSEPNPRKRERHTVNVLTRHFWTAIGQVYGEDFKPDMLFARDDETAQAIVRHARRAYDFIWAEEVDAQAVIMDLIIECFAFGTVAARCRWNPIAGEYLVDMPMSDGKPLGDIELPPAGRPIRDPEHARAFVADRRYYGDDVKMLSQFEGKNEWQVHSPFGILVPPGLPHERLFPWVGLEQPVPLEDAQATYGDAAADLKEMDLDAVDLVGMRDQGANDPSTGGSGKIKGHVLLTHIFNRPNAKHPEGQVVTFAGDTLLRVEDKLPYKVNGERKAGIVFFKYHRVPRRFWAIGVLEPGIGPQRQRNRARSQQIEAKDKNLGRVYAYKGTLTESNRPVGKIMEVIDVSRSAPALPNETAGVQMPWIAEETKQNDDDLERVMGQSEVSLGQAPRGVSAYSAFALLAEQDDKRVGPILAAFRTGFIELSKFTMHNVREYWPPTKNIVLAGPDNQVESFMWNTNTLPEEIFFRYGTGGPPRPKSPAAQIQLIFDLFDRSTATGRPLPLDWLYDSLDAGKPLPLPKEMGEVQRQKAELENNLANMGHAPTVDPLDDGQVHIPIHQAAIAALQLIPGAEPVIAILQQHVQDHQNEAQAAAAAASTVPGMQGPQGALSQQAPQSAPGDQPIDPQEAAMQTRYSNNLSPMPGNVGGFGIR